MTRIAKTLSKLNDTAAAARKRQPESIVKHYLVNSALVLLSISFAMALFDAAVYLYYSGLGT